MSFAFIRTAFIKPVFAATLSFLIMMVTNAGAEPATIDIVVIGASNTLGWGVLPKKAYPAQLQAMLRDKGYNVRITNAGVIFSTTAGMLRRLDWVVPEGTRIVIIQPGSNDLRFFGTREKRAANIAAMVERLRVRNIRVIVFDPIIPAKYYQWDKIHFSAKGHAMLAAMLLPQVMTAITQ